MTARRREHGHLPIIEHAPVEIGADEVREIANMAARIRQRNPAIGAGETYGRAVRVGLAPGGSLFLHDTAGIQSAGRAEASGLEYRPLALAGDGDCLAISVARVPAFERYCRDFLGLGSVEVIRTAASERRASLATLCRRDPAVLARLAEIARARGGMTVQPYVSSGAVWRLAAAIARRAGVPVGVAAPPPALAHYVNDKLWFARRVVELLGPAAVPRGYEARDLAALARHAAELARESDQLVIKLPRAAGSLGNALLDGSRLRTLSHAALEREIAGFLSGLGWRRPFPLLIAIWESPVALSPSVQLWIPLSGEGLPLVEGIFDQIVSGAVGRFIGAVPSGLPARVRRRIAYEAVRLCTLFQQLGYFGRCSLDAILVGRDVEHAALRWVECNGRWGGTSTPMTLVNRLTGDWVDSPFVALQPDWRLRLGFEEVLDRTRDVLFRPGSRSGVAFASPGDLAAGTGIAYVGIGEDIDAGRRQARHATELLRG
ncbi:MAG TPA: peptide ligase PGM1-related protein [Longimicrobiales bacterium]